MNFYNIKKSRLVIIFFGFLYSVISITFCADFDSQLFTAAQEGNTQEINSLLETAEIDDDSLYEALAVALEKNHTKVADQLIQILSMHQKRHFLTRALVQGNEGVAIRLLEEKNIDQTSATNKHNILMLASIH